MALPTIMQMVFNRLPFLNANPDAAELIEAFTYEVAYELETCFKIRFYTDSNGTVIEDWTRVGVEAYYRLDQKSIIADLVASYILTMLVVTNTQGDGTEEGTPKNLKFLKRAKAGSAEVEWGQFSVKDGTTFFLSAEKLLDKYKADAARKARNLGCILDICDDCTAAVVGPMPFITVGGCGCC